MQPWPKSIIFFLYFETMLFKIWLQENRVLLIGTGASMNVQCARCEVALAHQIGRQCWPNVQESLLAERVRTVVGVPLELCVLKRRIANQNSSLSERRSNNLPVRPTTYSRVAIFATQTYRMCPRILNHRHNVALACLSVWPPKMCHCWSLPMDHIWHCPHRTLPMGRWPTPSAAKQLLPHKSTEVSAFSPI